MVLAMDNGKDASCEVNHLASKEPLSVSHRIKVLFPPKKIVGRALPAAVDEGDQTVLSCDASSSNPPSNITWKSNDKFIEGSSQYYSESQYHGKATRSELVVRAEATDDGRIYTCSASNGIPQQATTTNISISVRHAPVWVIKPPDQIDVYEGKDLVVRAVAASNPGPLRYWWRKESETLPSVGGELHLDSIRRENTGNYTVTASSVRGMINSTFVINVQYPPEFITSVPNVTIEERGSTSITCSAKGNPSPKIIWSRNNNSVALATGIKSAKLELKRVTRTDIGEYICTATNGVSLPALVKTKVIVTHKPEVLDEVTNARNTWAEIGGRAVLSCRARAAPMPSFEWTVNQGSLISNSTKYRVWGPQLVDGLTVWVSTMEIVDVDSSDYVEYRCNVHNALGTDTILVALNTPDKPDPPISFRVINTTSSTISLAWRRNELSDGPVHRYTIRYKHEKEPGFKEVHLSPEDTSVTLRNLYPGSRYLVTSYSSNNIGESELVEPPLLVVLPDVIQNVVGQRSSSVSSNSHSRDSGVSIAGWRVPRLVLLITCLTGATLLILNIVIISCFVKRRNSRTILGKNNGPAEHRIESLPLTGGEKSLGSTNSSSTNEIIIGREKSNSIASQTTTPQHLTPHSGSFSRTSTSPIVIRCSQAKGTEQLSGHSVDLLKDSISPAKQSSDPPRNTGLTDKQSSLRSFSTEETSLNGYIINTETNQGYTFPETSDFTQNIFSAVGDQNGTSHKLQHPPDKYSSLSAANLCQIETSCYDPICCSQAAQVCPCKNMHPGSMIGYATLAPRSRKMSQPHFSTLQRPKRHDSRYNQHSLDSFSPPTPCPASYTSEKFCSSHLPHDPFLTPNSLSRDNSRPIHRSSSLKSSSSRSELLSMSRQESDPTRPHKSHKDVDSDSDSCATSREPPKLRPKSVLKNPNRTNKPHVTNEVHFAGSYVYSSPTNDAGNGGSRVKIIRERPKFPNDYIKQSVGESGSRYSFDS